MRRLLVLAAFALAGPLPAATGNDSVRIYRCTASNGAVSLQNAPCSGGREQVLDMQRPQDPPPRKQAAPSASVSSPPPREVRIVTVTPPQPMYECVTADGERYTSDTDDGNPRWVPAWTLGYAPARARGGSDGGDRHGHGHGGGTRGVIVPYGNVQVRDSCHALPPREVCARLGDRRWELIRRYNSALQSEREALVREQRGIEARMDQDCGGA